MLLLLLNQLITRCVAISTVSLVANLPVNNPQQPIHAPCFSQTKERSRNSFNSLNYIKLAEVIKVNDDENKGKMRCLTRIKIATFSFVINSEIIPQLQRSNNC